MTTTILPSTGLDELLSGKVLFLDTNVFIGASLSGELSGWLAALLADKGCEILTISSVSYEFARGSKTLEEFNTRRKFINDLTKIIPVGRLLENDNNNVFSLVMSRLVSARDSDYTDFLLATCLYQYSKLETVYLMTADVRSMPRAIFDVKGNITCVDSKDNMGHYVIYCLNKDNFTSAARDLQQTKGRQLGLESKEAARAIPLAS
jgi:hypothetical protein